MPRLKTYPRARLKQAAFEAVIQAQGRRLGWIAKQAGIHPNHLSAIRSGLECPYARAVLIARVLEREVAELFDVVQAPPSPAEEGRAA